MTSPGQRGPVVVDTDVYSAELVPGSLLADRYAPLLERVAGERDILARAALPATPSSPCSKADSTPLPTRPTTGSYTAMASDGPSPGESCHRVERRCLRDGDHGPVRDRDDRTVIDLGDQPVIAQ